MRPGPGSIAPILIGAALLAVTPPASAGGLGKPMGLDECWQGLPMQAPGGKQRLPNWALLTARTLPRTTVAMLELDWIHRTRSPLGPVLRGQMRWVAADANRCEYARATAEADLRREGLRDAQIAALKAGPDAWPARDRTALAFALHMTLDAGAVTDGEVAALRKAYGEEKVVAMVLLLAAANFQDRLLLSLGVPPEEGGPLAPIEIHLPKDAKVPVPVRAKPEDLHGPAVPTVVDDPEWAAISFDVLQKGLDSQRSNDGRVRVPTFDEVLKALPPDATPPKNPIRIKWTLVCMGYQPRLALAWSACMTAFREEAKQDRIFEESLFWVITRTIHCFY